MGCLVEEQTTDMRGEPRNVVCMAIEMDTLYTRPDYPMNRSGKAQSNRCRPPCQIQRVNAGSGFQMPVSFRVFGHASLSECACIPHRHPQWRGQLHVDANISQVIKNTVKNFASRGYRNWNKVPKQRIIALRTLPILARGCVQGSFRT